MLTFLLVLAALVCFVIATFGLLGRINWVAAGLFCWCAATFLPLLRAL